ncbi:MAG: hypothetical protein H7A51_19405 [Akkermansiaceae bacterium]|nr:hypothetical protein [Akkermansiaceae bacterium]
MRNAPPKLTKPEHWAEWFDKCALSRCGDETRAALGKFAHERYRKKLFAAVGYEENNLPVHARDLYYSGNCEDCWYDLEESYWFRSKPNRNSKDEGSKEGAKVYKKFHLEVASTKGTPEEARNYLEAKCTDNLIKSRCRTIVTQSRKFSSEIPDDTNRDVSQGETPDESSILDLNAKSIIRKIFDDLSEEEKILLLAKAYTIKLGHPEILHRLGASQSTLYTRQKILLDRVLSRLKREGFTAEDLPEATGFLFRLLAEWANSSECGIGNCLIANGV